MAMFLYILNKLFIFFRSPGSFLKAILITTRRPSHGDLFLYLIIFAFFLLLLPSVSRKPRAYYLYTIICLILVVNYSQLKNLSHFFIRWTVDELTITSGYIHTLFFYEMTNTSLKNYFLLIT